MAGRLVLLVTTHRVAPGLLSWPAWSALQGADEVLAATASHPLAAALEDAGVTLRVPAADDDVAGFLFRRAAAGTVVWLCGPDGDGDLVDAVTTVLSGATQPSGATELIATAELPEVEILVGSWDPPGARLLDLVTVMDRLRSPGGCPWDADQTHTTLLQYLLEEAYEVVEAVETDDRAAFREELGDLLLQVFFHARMAEEDPDDPWSVDDVAAGIVAKLISRHPHVFEAGGPDSGIDTATKVEANWEELKRVEKGRTSAMDGVPLAQPALALASKLIYRAERSGVAASVEAGHGESAANGWDIDPQTRIGSQLFELVARARSEGVDPEMALRAAARSYAERVREAEAAASPVGDPA